MPPLAARCLTIRGRTGTRPIQAASTRRQHGAPGTAAPAPLRLLGASRCAAGRGLEAPPLVRKSPRLVCAGAVCWPPAPPWSRSRAWLPVGWRGSPRRRAGSLPWPWPPPSVGRALRCLSWRCRAALRRGGGGLTCPPPPLGWRNSFAMALAAAGAICWAVAAPGHKMLRQVRPLPPVPLPPPGGGGTVRRSAYPSLLQFPIHFLAGI